MTSKNKRQPLKWALGIGVIAVALGIVATLNFGDSMVYFYTPSEALATPAKLSQKTIRVGAMVKAGTVDWNARDLILKFVMTDMKGHDIAVVHKGAPPDLFKENTGVVAEGYISEDGKDFKAHRLMVKHSEEYRKPEDHASMDRALLEDSLFKGEQSE